MKRVTLLFICFLFLIVRPQQLYQSTLFYCDDDHDYFARATSIAFGQFPSYDKENYSSGPGQPLGSIGPGLMASPFVFLFSRIDAMLGSSIMETRTQENMIHSWSLFGFVVASLTYFWLACLLLYQGLIKHISKNTAFLAIVLVIFCQGIALYAFRRPVFSHMYEFFLQSVMMYWLLTITDAERSRVRLFLSALIGSVAGLILLVRYNNILFALAWPLVLLWCGKRKWRAGLANISIAFVFILAALCFKGWLDAVKPTPGYSSVLGGWLMPKAFSYYPAKIWHIFVGLDWGLVYTLPFCLLGFVSMFFLSFPNRKRLWFACLPLLVNFTLLIQMNAQAGWYGYRHIMASSIPLMIYPVGMLLRKFTAWPWRVLLFLIALFPFMSMLLYDANSQLTLFMHYGWNNPEYQLLVWKTVLFEPLVILIALSKGGLMYVFYPIALHFPHFTDSIQALNMDFVREIVSDQPTRIKYLTMLLWPVFWLITGLTVRFLWRKSTNNDCRCKCPDADHAVISKKG